MITTLRRLTGYCTFILFLVLFCDAGSTGQGISATSWLADMQLVPALLAGSVTVLFLILLVTLLFGRVYCSVLCPLGLLQELLCDLVPQKRVSRQKNPLRDRPLLRRTLLTVFVLSLLAGAALPVALLEPYSIFGRIATALFEPVVHSIHNGLCVLFGSSDTSTVAPLTLYSHGAGVTMLSLVYLLLITGLTLRFGRIWCTTICPVGTVLGCLSRHARLVPAIDQDACRHCRACERVCRASCITSENATIDTARCVACMNCLDACPHDALHMQLRRLTLHTQETPDTPAGQRSDPQRSDPQRRGVLLGLAAIFVAPQALRAERSGTEEPGSPSGRSLSETAGSATDTTSLQSPLLPPGAVSRSDFTSRCTGCQLCVSACPEHVLRATAAGGLNTLLQPSMFFADGYCRPTCVRCTTVCPTGALRPLTQERKREIRTGRAHVDPARCVVTTDRLPCTACEKACPYEAIRRFVTTPGTPVVPDVNGSLCTGCGACEHFCPVRPLAAIRVLPTDD